MKKLLTTGLAALSPFALPVSAFAQSVDPCQNGAGGSAFVGCSVAGQGIGNIIGDIVQFIFVIAVILALGFLVYGGIRWLTSGGDKDAVATARGTIIAAIIGLIIIFLAYFILNFILLFLTGQTFDQIQIPSLT